MALELRLTDAERSFRDELREWLAATLPGLPAPPAGDDWPARRVFDTDWQRLLFDAGYAGIGWARSFGGRGASPGEELIFLEETERAGAPYVGCNFVGTLHAGPTLIAEGSPDQQGAHLEPILRGDHVWCQGFSEPEAGSDLASLRTTAVRDGDVYVINGSKIWTSHAHVADYCELLVRTDPGAPKHRGITWLIMPMHLKGIDVRPLRTATGVGEFNELFLDNVEVPVANRVGAENDGWRVAMVTFSFERGTALASEVVRSQQLVLDLVRIARSSTNPTSSWNDASIRRELAQVAANLDGLWALTRRNVSRSARGETANVGGSILKLVYGQTRARLGHVAMRILDRAGLALSDSMEVGHMDHVEERIYALSLGIAAGTTQIQRNLIAERTLGLPKERAWTSN